MLSSSFTVGERGLCHSSSVQMGRVPVGEDKKKKNERKPFGLVSITTQRGKKSISSTMSVFIFSFRAVIKGDKTKPPRQSSFELMHRLKIHKRFTQLVDSNYSSVTNPEKVERSNCEQSFAYEKYWTTPLNL